MNNYFIKNITAFKIARSNVWKYYGLDYIVKLKYYICARNYVKICILNYEKYCSLFNKTQLMT